LKDYENNVPRIFRANSIVKKAHLFTVKKPSTGPESVCSIPEFCMTYFTDFVIRLFVTLPGTLVPFLLHIFPFIHTYVLRRSIGSRIIQSIPYCNYKSYGPSIYMSNRTPLLATFVATGLDT